MYKCGGIASEEDALLEMIERGELIGVKPTDIKQKPRQERGLTKILRFLGCLKRGR